MNEPRPTSTRQVHLAARPQGALTLDAFTTVEVPLRAPGRARSSSGTPTSRSAP